jgi:hypothetical protein
MNERQRNSEDFDSRAAGHRRHNAGTWTASAKSQNMVAIAFCRKFMPDVPARTDHQGRFWFAAERK